jgi:hypothetical protein
MNTLSLLLLLYVAWDMPASLERAGGKVTLRPCRWVRCLFLFAAFGLPVAIMVVTTVDPPRSEVDTWVLFFSLVLAGVLLVPVWWWFTRISLTISAEGLLCRCAWSSRLVPWDEVSLRSHGGVFGGHVLEIRGRSWWVCLSEARIPGVDLLLAALEQHRRDQGAARV